MRIKLKRTYLKLQQMGATLQTSRVKKEHSLDKRRTAPRI